MQNVGVYLHLEQDYLEVRTDNETVVAVEAFLQAQKGWVSWLMHTMLVGFHEGFDAENFDLRLCSLWTFKACVPAPVAPSKSSASKL